MWFLMITSPMSNGKIVDTLNKGHQMKEFIYGLVTIALVIFFAYCFSLTI